MFRRLVQRLTPPTKAGGVKSFHDYRLSPSRSTSPLAVFCAAWLSDTVSAGSGVAAGCGAVFVRVGVCGSEWIDAAAPMGEMAIVRLPPCRSSDRIRHKSRPISMTFCDEQDLSVQAELSAVM